MTLRIKGSQARSQQTRADILDAVKALLASNSFDDITLAQIAAEAGIAKGSVLALGDAMDSATEALRSRPGCAARPEDLVATILPLLDFLKTDRALARLLATDGADSQCAVYLDPAQSRLRAALVDAFAARPDPGLAADVTMALTVHVAVAAECQTGAEAGAALQRLLAVIYH